MCVHKPSRTQLIGSVMETRVIASCSIEVVFLCVILWCVCVCECVCVCVCVGMCGCVCVCEWLCV